MTAQVLVLEAIRKAAVAWVTVAGHPTRALWCHPVDGELWVVSGPGEQAAPGLDRASEVRIGLRGDHGGRIVEWTAAVARVAPDDERWEAVVPQLAGKRLNAPLGPAALAQRWARECAVHVLTPAGDGPGRGGRHTGT